MAHDALPGHRRGAPPGGGHARALPRGRVRRGVLRGPGGRALDATEGRRRACTAPSVWTSRRGRSALPPPRFTPTRRALTFGPPKSVASRRSFRLFRKTVKESLARRAPLAQAALARPEAHGPLVVPGGGAEPAHREGAAGPEDIRTTINLYGHLLPSVDAALAGGLDRLFDAAQQTSPERVPSVQRVYVPRKAERRRAITRRRPRYYPNSYFFLRFVDSLIVPPGLRRTFDRFTNRPCLLSGPAYRRLHSSWQAFGFLLFFGRFGEGFDKTPARWTHLESTLDGPLGAGRKGVEDLDLT